MFTQICVFCGSSPGRDPAYLEAARAVGGLLARRGLGLVYGGGKTGLMGALADAVLAGGGRVMGVIPKGLATKELVHDGLTDLRLVSSMHERKALMAELSGAFLALPGGFGTFEEFCEILTWAQLGLHRKPCGLLNIKGYFNPLLELFDHAVTEGFLRAADRANVLSEDAPGPLLSQMEAFVPVAAPRWLDPSET